MKNIIITLALILAFALAAFAQTATDATAATFAPAPRATFTAYHDTFAGPAGVVLEPQYLWTLNVTGPVRLSGFGFVESAPHEPGFTKHQVAATWSRLPLLSAHAEFSRCPNLPDTFAAQIGPRLNLGEMKHVGKYADFLNVAFLPKASPNSLTNILIAGATKELTRVPKTENKLPVALHVEGFRQMYKGGGDYGEVWLLARVPRLKHVTPGMHWINSAGHNTLSIGFRLQ